MVLEHSFLWTKDYLYYGLTRSIYPYLGYQGVVLFPAIITVYLLAKSYKKILDEDNLQMNEAIQNRGLNISFYLLLSFVLLLNSSDFLFQIINQTRQIMSLAFALMGAISYFYKKRFIAIICFFCAVFSHHSSPLVIVCVFSAYYIRDTRLWILLLLIVTFLSISGISKELLSIAGLTIDEDSIYYQALNSNAVLYFKSGITCALGITCYLVNRKRIDKKGFYNFLINLYFAICVLAMLFIVYGEASNRIQRYAGVIFPILFVLSIRRIKITELKIFIIVMLSLIYMIFLMNYDATLITIGIYRNINLPL